MLCANCPFWRMLNLFGGWKSKRLIQQMSSEQEIFFPLYHVLNNMKYEHYQIKLLLVYTQKVYGVWIYVHECRDSCYITLYFNLQAQGLSVKVPDRLLRKLNHTISAHNQLSLNSFGDLNLGPIACSTNPSLQP